jgi:hypothetical protein
MLDVSVFFNVCWSHGLCSADIPTILPTEFAPVKAAYKAAY